MIRPGADMNSDSSARLPDAMAERMADTMFALSTPSRLQILVCLRAAPRTVTEIVDAVGMEQSAVSHQLRVLRQQSVVSVRRIGRTRQYTLRNQHVGALIDDALAHLQALDSGDAGTPRTHAHSEGDRAAS
jgi:ArsR family transcriptional regulator, nickel/cobalt-responsive transcriptional repressor